MAALFGAVGFACILWARPGRTVSWAEQSVGSKSVKLIILGNHQGYLTPCGCSEPMTGGVLREASLIRKLQGEGPTAVIDTGDLTASDSKQEAMKAETLAETLGSVHTAAIALTAGDLKLEAGQLQNLQNLAKNAFTTATLDSVDLQIDPFKVSDGFIILSLRALGGEDSESRELALLRAHTRAQTDNLREVVMVEDTEAKAETLVADHPEIDIVTYRSSAAPSLTAKQIGKTWLVSPGERGEYMLSIEFQGTHRVYSRYHLTQEIQDDATADRFYREYLRRVDRDPDLWDHHPRQPGQPYAGSEKCAKCHEAEYKVWKTADWQSPSQLSSHRRALQTLLAKGHGRDPECLSCHVTGAGVTTGYRSVAKDPQLGAVTCESCHGAGGAHVAAPVSHPMITKRTAGWSQFCSSCHDPLNSPNFDFLIYWTRIRHGNGDKRWKSKK